MAPEHIFGVADDVPIGLYDMVRLILDINAKKSLEKNAGGQSLNFVRQLNLAKTLPILHRAVGLGDHDFPILVEGRPMKRFQHRLPLAVMQFTLKSQQRGFRSATAASIDHGLGSQGIASKRQISHDKGHIQHDVAVAEFIRLVNEYFAYGAGTAELHCRGAAQVHRSRWTVVLIKLCQIFQAILAIRQAVAKEWNRFRPRWKFIFAHNHTLLSPAL